MRADAWATAEPLGLAVPLGLPPEADTTRHAGACCAYPAPKPGRYALRPMAALPSGSPPLRSMARWAPTAILVIGGLAALRSGQAYLKLLARAPYGEFLGGSERTQIARRLGQYDGIATWILENLEPDAVLAIEDKFRNDLGGLASDLRVLIYPRMVTPIHVPPGDLLDHPMAA